MNQKNSNKNKIFSNNSYKIKQKIYIIQNHYKVQIISKEKKQNSILKKSIQQIFIFIFSFLIIKQTNNQTKIIFKILFLTLDNSPEVSLHNNLIIYLTSTKLSHIFMSV